MLIRAVAAGWQQRTVMNIQLEKAFNEIKKSKTGIGGKRDGRGSFAHREPWNIPRIVRFDKKEIISNFVT
jgi:hypothetical protein